MDLKGSLVNTTIKIYPTEKLIRFLKTITITDDLPHNISQIVKGNDKATFKTYNSENKKPVHLSNSDIEYIKKIKAANPITSSKEPEINKTVTQTCTDKNIDKSENDNHKKIDSDTEEHNTGDSDQKDSKIFLVTADIDWLYDYLKSKRSNGEDIPYLHALLEGANIEVPENETIKRNPILEARCVKLRAQQEAREYRKMTKGVDNVRMRFPEDSISYQMKQLNRQLIAIGQFIISIFAGFLFGFRGVEWMVGNLDFGFRLLLGVMCALVIALAEIYFLAKKLNEELSIPETVQLGGPTKFADQENFTYNSKKTALEKPHQD